MKLNPCPFCGEDVIGIYNSFGDNEFEGFHCYCHGCYARGPDFASCESSLKELQQTAIEAWNKRI